MADWEIGLDSIFSIAGIGIGIIIFMMQTKTAKKVNAITLELDERQQMIKKNRLNMLIQMLENLKRGHVDLAEKIETYTKTKNEDLKKEIVDALLLHQRDYELGKGILQHYWLGVLDLVKNPSIETWMFETIDYNYYSPIPERHWDSEKELNEHARKLRGDAGLIEVPLEHLRKELSKFDKVSNSGKRKWGYGLRNLRKSRKKSA